MPEPNISTCQDVGMWQIFVRWPLVVNLMCLSCDLDLWPFKLTRAMGNVYANVDFFAFLRCRARTVQTKGRTGKTRRAAACDIDSPKYENRRRQFVVVEVCLPNLLTGRRDNHSDVSSGLGDKPPQRIYTVSCGWLCACGKARGRHFEHLQLTGSVQSHPHSPGEDTCLWRTKKTQFPGSCFPR